MSKYEEMEAVMAPLWRLSASQAGRIFQNSAFKWFERHCKANFGTVSNHFAVVFPLLDALRALGLPSEQPQGVPALDVQTAARRFIDALEAPTLTRRYMAPLHLADTLPALSFGNARVTSFSIEELKSSLEYDRLLRQGHGALPDLSRLVQLQWLVVEHTETTPANLMDRSSKVFDFADADAGAIVPHEGRYPAPFMKALFALLLQPWEDWHDHGDLDWRTFEIPWVHVATGDIFDPARSVPSTEDLAFTPHMIEDEEVGEDPVIWDLDRAAGPALSTIDDAYWDRLEKARLSVLFETPVAHFMLQAYFASGMDEIIAHMTAIEAAVGLRSDFGGGGGAKRRVTNRVSRLLADDAAGNAYGDLFEIRSQFVHGRKIDDKVPSEKRNLARSLARRVAKALVDEAQTLPDRKSREDFLNALG